MAADQHPLLVEALANTEPTDKRLFDLLKKAYIEARYSGSYRITQEELTTLQARVVALAERVRAACIEKLGSFCGPQRVGTELPTPPQLREPLLSPLASPPAAPNDFLPWAQSVAEVSEQVGAVRGRAEALLLVRRSRGLSISREVEQRILSCEDPVVLAAWLQRAVTITSAEDLLVG